MRIRTKSCPRCRGDLSLERDQYGSYVECIQCGATWYLSHFPASDTQNKDSRHETSRRKPVAV